MPFFPESHKSSSIMRCCNDKLPGILSPHPRHEFVHHPKVAPIIYTENLKLLNTYNLFKTQKAESGQRSSNRSSTLSIFKLTFSLVYESDFSAEFPFLIARDASVPNIPAGICSGPRFIYDTIISGSAACHNRINSAKTS